jgi:hypothetical protein
MVTTGTAFWSYGGEGDDDDDDISVTDENAC